MSSEYIPLQFTSKMEGMVTDLALARDKQQNFDEWKSGHNKQLPIDISVTVLTTGALTQTYVVVFESLGSLRAREQLEVGGCLLGELDFISFHRLDLYILQCHNKQLPIDISVTVLTTGVLFWLSCGLFLEGR
jgi:hypothetical protein